MELIRKAEHSADKVHEFAENKGFTRDMHIGSNVVSHTVVQPGWDWTTHAKPRVDTDSCQKSHVVYVNSGQLAVKMDDQSEPVTLVAGDAAKVPPGHVAYVVGNEPVDMIEFASGAQ